MASDPTDPEKPGAGDGDVSAAAADASAPADEAAPREVDPRLLEILVCPLTKQPLSYDRERQELISRSARLAYPIRNGVPIMLVDEARSMDDG